MKPFNQKSRLWPSRQNEPGTILERGEPVPVPEEAAAPTTPEPGRGVGPALSRERPESLYGLFCREKRVWPPASRGGKSPLAPGLILGSQKVPGRQRAAGTAAAASLLGPDLPLAVPSF